jgi:hypothetical protein
MNSITRTAAPGSSRTEKLCNWLALLTLLALGIVLPGTRQHPAAASQAAQEVPYREPLSR